jgi:Ras-related protein Rab-7A
MMELNNRLVQAQIWDTAGQERFKSLSQSFYRGSDACVIVYDVTNPESSVHVQEWKEEFIKYCDPPNLAEFPFLILGNKCDGGDSAAGQYRKRPNVRNEHHFYVSAKTGHNVEQSFQKVVEIAAAQSAYDDVPEPPNGGLFINGKIDIPKQKTTCCE